ncbi:nucleotidyltransferase family protein [Sphingomonas sp. Leaf62]|uniref:nucleotidyltransferase family protein n=1 Tax=Sphingomonas sp. Leaf62 TaxID=1736228 RepID=UPI0006FF1BF7|nr:nucleotidyltransferase family protein [Sphingomonas sp. Leaf62]KQN71993.1 hypothetical protein ASE91_04735 [Sphingomonas sp. Leaf62]
MDAHSQVIAILRADPLRWHLLGVVRALNLRDGWIAAGFVRNAVWDHLHGRAPSAPTGDVDVIWYDPLVIDPVEDRRYEAMLRAAEPGIAWSVKNQARMHVRNDDRPYLSATDAMRHWPETATAIAVRRRGEEGCEVAAPLGLNDLMHLILRPTSRFIDEKRAMYDGRVASKRWIENWPRLRQEPGEGR